jgi:HtrA serine peptidase 2
MFLRRVRAPLARAVGARRALHPPAALRALSGNTRRNTPSARAWGAGAASTAVAALVLAGTFPAPQAHAQNKQKNNFIADAVDKASPSLVYVSSTLQMFFGEIGQGGSGFVVHESGFIATNSHVVAAAATNKGKQNLTVTMSDGKTFEGEVWAMDVNSDLALIKINPGAHKLTKATIGSSTELRPGEWVAALGSPMNLQNTVTVGVVSSSARQATDLGLNRAFDFVQTDCSINSGNSGGPLVDLDGKVIGINTMKVSGPEGISFAIPIDVAWPILEQLREFRRVKRPYLGLKMVTIDRHIAMVEQSRNPEFPQDVESGVLVAHVQRASPAERAGLQPGDVITEIDNAKVHSSNDVLKALGFEVGKKMQFTVHRGRTGVKTLSVMSEVAPVVLG